MPAYRYLKHDVNADKLVVKGYIFYRDRYTKVLNEDAAELMSMVYKYGNCCGGQKNQQRPMFIEVVNEELKV